MTTGQSLTRRDGGATMGRRELRHNLRPGQGQYSPGYLYTPDTGAGRKRALTPLTSARWEA